MKKRCKKCGKLIDSRFRYCPYCGAKLIEPDGLLDRIDELMQPSFGSFGFDDFATAMMKNFSTVFSGLLEEIERQFREIDKQLANEKQTKPKVSGISISISTSTGKKPKIEVRRIGKGKVSEVPIKVKVEPIKKTAKLDEKTIKKIAKLPKKEAKSSVKRLSDRIVYEIDMPGVQSEKDVFITKLHNSIEIKAVAKDKVYFKLIPLALPIINYRLENEKLILELKPQE